MVECEPASPSPRRQERRISRIESSSNRKVDIPEPLTSGELLESLRWQDVSNSDGLANWLHERGLDTHNWGQGKSKEISKLWHELQGEECNVELWRTSNNDVKPVRVVHVLRAKVCSPESCERGIYLFNTWQQYADGRSRTRNGLLSEKLSVGEMPLELHLQAVCERAISEEMQRLENSAFRIGSDGSGHSSPEYNPAYTSPICVVDERYVERGSEVENSDSYPGLLTMYHLYTVEIICEGLPSVDFTTLEFDAADEHGCKKLKYVHAWVWLEWSMIQRYLLEGSTLKDRKTIGSFDSPQTLEYWLGQFDVDSNRLSLDDLFSEVERGESQLEHWGRHDGVPLLIRVVHIVQLEVRSSDPRLLGKFLLQTWRQYKGSRPTSVNGFMTKSLSVMGLPIDEQRLAAATSQIVQEELGYLTDPHFRLDSQASKVKLEPSGVQIVKVELIDHHSSLSESGHFSGMITMHQKYNMHVECQGLPLGDFGSIILNNQSHNGNCLDFVSAKACLGYSWVTWPTCLDMWQKSTHELERKQFCIQRMCTQQEQILASGAKSVSRLENAIVRLAAKTSSLDPDVLEAQLLLRELHHTLTSTRNVEQLPTACANINEYLPPSMVSEMSQNTIVPKDILDSALRRRMEVTSKMAAIYGELLPCGASATAGKLAEAFSTVGLDRHTTISEEEFVKVFQSLIPTLTPRELRTVFVAVDENQKGIVNYDDFLGWLYRECGGKY